LPILRFVALMAATSDQRFLTSVGGPTGTPIYVPSSGMISGNVTCTTSTPCAGSVKYVIQQIGVRTAAKAPARVRTIVLGSATFRLHGHTSRRVTVKLNRVARRVMRGKRVIRVLQLVTVSSGKGRTVLKRAAGSLRALGERAR
jgi:hypothetical protein